MGTRLDDPARLAALGRAALLDAGGDVALDRLAALTARVLRASVATVTLVDDERHVAAGAYGSAERTLPLEASFCRRVVETGEPLVVEDTRLHPLLRDNPSTAAGAIAYAGVPLRAGGHALGSLCVVEPHPRAWTAEDVELLELLAGAVAGELSLRLAAAEARGAEGRFRMLVERIPTVTYTTGGDGAGDIRYMSPQIEEWTGLPPEHFLGALDAWYDLMHPDDRARVEHEVDDAHAAGRPFSAEYRLRAADGGWRWVLDREELVTAETALGVMTDVTAIRALEATEAQLRSVVAHAPMVLFALDAEGRVTMLEGSRVEALRLPPTELVGRVLTDLLPPDSRITANLRRALAGESFRDVVPLGDLWFDTYYQALPAGGIMGVATDVTERERSERAIAHLAYHDALTGLPNRANLEEQLARSLARARRSGGSLALLSIDLDDFKLVNDSLGHPAGDELLRRLSRRLLGVLRDGDLLARQGGDEFILLLDELQGPPLEAARSVAAKLLDALHEPFELDGTELHVGASIGIGVFPEHGADADELLKHADVALYSAKASGRGAAAVYARERDDTHRRLTLTARLRRALREGEFVLHFQPIVRLATGELEGHEALIRWQDPEEGLLAPGAFIAHAEESGLIDAIGAWVADESCRQLRAWQDLGLETILGFNVAPRQLRRADFARLVGDAVARHGVRARDLTIEITESAAMQEPARTLPILQALRELGVTVAIDDFGAQHSSLARLRDLPVEALKVDRSFLRGVPGDGRAEEILRAILGLAHALGMNTVAEGVETEAQRLFLAGQGCRLAQGFHLGRPVPAEEATRRLLEARRGPALRAVA